MNPAAPLTFFQGHGVNAHRQYIQYSLFEDKGYFTNASGTIISQYKRDIEGEDLSHDEKEFNACMSRVRIAVEWGFNKVVQKFGYLDTYKQLKLWGTPVGPYYEVATLLTNFHTCLYGSQTSTYFQVPPPSLDEFLAMAD